MFPLDACNLTITQIFSEGAKGGGEGRKILACDLPKTHILAPLYSPLIAVHLSRKLFDYTTMIYPIMICPVAWYPPSISLAIFDKKTYRLSNLQKKILFLRGP